MCVESATRGRPHKRCSGRRRGQLEHDAALLKRVYRLTAEAIGPLGESKGLLTALEVREMVEGLTRLEEDPASVLVKFPDIWIIAQRS